MEADLITQFGQYGLGGLALYIIWQLHRKELKTLIDEQRRTNRFLRAMIIALGRADLLRHDDR